MARIRTVKPELFRHEGLYELEIETGLPIRIAFAGLFTVCDRRGRFVWRPRQLKLDVLPYDEIDFSRVLDALVTRGFVVRYENSGELYGCIPSFERHQVINNRESESELPDHLHQDSKAIDSIDDLTRQSRVNHASATRLVQDKAEGKGREGNITLSNNACDESIPPADHDENATADDTDFGDYCTGEQLQFDAQHLRMAQTTGLILPDDEIQLRFDLFRCYGANANSLKSKSEWLNAWRTWCQREKVQHATQSKPNAGNGRNSATQSRNESPTHRAMRLAQEAAERAAADQGH